MVGDFFPGFAGHAYTRNDLEADPNKATQLRRENSVEKARKLTEAVLDKLERAQEQKDLGIKGWIKVKK